VSITELERDAALAHFGVKGMKWGVRKAQTVRGGRYALKDDATERRLVEGTPPAKKGLTPGQKKALKTTAAVVGTAAALYVINKNHQVKVDALVKSIDQSRANINASAKEFNRNLNRLDAQQAKMYQQRGAAAAQKMAAQHAAKGKQRLADLDKEMWNMSVSKLSADMAKASAAEALNTRRTLNQMPSIVTNERSRRLIGL
jgi:hypothetical protein